ncbi:hypothetical protein EDB85DRAFT_1891104 [Lactarius pseudohatsudake]|nr:hypothetical protein EDB85DRAFT_1891104 [Lactarius pseudohatsudake]
MPHDPETGKAIRIKFTEEDLYDFRFQQYEKKLNQAGKEGGVAEDHSPKHLQSQPTASGSNLSPSSVLEQPLHGMTLESGGSSHADSPATQPGSASSPASFYIEVPKFGSKFRQPRRQPSPTTLSQSSDDGRNNAARIAVLEGKMKKFEEWKKEVDQRLEEGGL